MKTIYYFILFLSIGFSMHVQAQKQKSLEEYIKNAPFKMPLFSAPTFPNKSFSITQYGAIGDGLALNTLAFAKAIDACTKAGGGKVVVPAGVWVTGPIELKSNVNLHVEQGAIILFTKDLTQYPIIKASGNSSTLTPASPIYGYDLTNIAITGKGIIDGSGEAWRPVKKNKLTASEWKTLTASGGVTTAKGDVWWPSKEAMEGEAYLKKLKEEKPKPTAEDYIPARTFLRPYMVYLMNCKNVLVDEITIRNSPKFVFYPGRCENLVISNATILNDWNAQNGDGIDISACKNVVIYNTTVSCGDDAICMKSSRGKSDNPADFQLENVVIEDCTVYTGHGGFVIGSNTDGNMRNISVRNCNFIGTDIGIRVKSNAGRGGVVKDIFIDKIYMANIKEEAILFDTYYEDVAVGKTTESATTTPQDKVPEFKNFQISNVVCNGAEKAVYINGLSYMPVHDINFSNITIISAHGVEANYSKDLKFNNVRIVPAKGEVYTVTNSQNYLLNDVYPVAGRTFFKAGEQTSNIMVSGKNANDVKVVEAGK